MKEEQLNNNEDKQFKPYWYPNYGDSLTMLNRNNYIIEVDSELEKYGYKTANDIIRYLVQANSDSLEDVFLFADLNKYDLDWNFKDVKILNSNNETMIEPLQKLIDNVKQVKDWNKDRNNYQSPINSIVFIVNTSDNYKFKPCLDYLESTIKDLKPTNGVDCVILDSNDKNILIPEPAIYGRKINIWNSSQGIKFNEELNVFSEQ